MKHSKSNCIGIDLTQSVPHLAIASDPVEATSSILANSPPAALLPVLRGESTLVGSAAHNHRRGVGVNWPPECQVPVAGDYQNGSGRVPLVCAWTRLANLSNNAFSGILGDTEISWQPPGQKRLYSTAEEMIAKSVHAWGNKYENNKTVVVIPDSLGEAAQQALVDNCGSFLIPRPIAVAMSWCRKNVGRFSGTDILSTRGVTLGHLLVITMPFDQWEIVPIEVRAEVNKETLWLVPVRNRVAGGGEFPRIGVNYFLAMATREEKTLQGLWNAVFGIGYNPLGRDVLSGSPAEYQAVRDCLTGGFEVGVKDLFQKLDGWSEIFAGSTLLSPDKFKDHLLVSYQKQLTCLSKSAQEKCLGVVIDGSCSNIPIAENRSLGEFIARVFKDQESIISDGSLAAQGAALTAYALEHNLPSYRETIIPLEIHYHGKNKKGDYVNAYKLLVEGKTVKAGKEYKSKEPVRGLNIKQGEKKLTITLRRVGEKEHFLFRRVTAEVPKPTRIDEEVKIVAHLRPGQGFAKVFVDSVNRDVFKTWLDWRTMESCEEPAPPPLAYLPEVSRVEHEEHMWTDAEYYVEDAIRELQSGKGRDLTDAMRELREGGKLNQWPMADSYDEYRGRKSQGDIFRHYGVCPSNGDLSRVSNLSLMNLFASECAKRFVDIRTTPAERKQIQQTAAWMYLACPPIIVDHVRKNLAKKLAQIPQEDLHAIGLCFCEVDDISLFFKAFEQRLLQGTTGVNNWLRACRNIVRFRDSALHTDIISSKRLDNIVHRVLRILEGQIEENNFGTIFNNCILTCLYLLKRRRYDEGFLSKEVDSYDEYFKINRLLGGLLKAKSRTLKDRPKTIINTTLKFLRKEASLKDLDSSVLTG